MSFLVYYFWVAPHVLLAGVIWLSLRRRIPRSFPLFFANILYDLISFLVLFTLYIIVKVPTHQYRSMGVLYTGLSIPFRLGVLYEIGKDVLRNRPHSAARLRPLLRWSFALLLLAAAASAGTQAYAGAEKLQNVFLSMELLWSLFACGAVLVLFAVTQHRYWSSYGAGIAFGFGVFAAVNLASSAFRAKLGTGGNMTISTIQMAGYHACVLIWLIYLCLPERIQPTDRAGLNKAELESWNDELHKIMRLNHPEL
ncbi:MAG TPA: hypothetical protein VJO35_09110 [Terriglobales bacterium]|nr:hypothetical protein [Terriglobales bacterium]